MVVPVTGVAEAVNVALEAVQVIEPDALQLTVGEPPLERSVVLADAVHPFPDWVTTTV